MQSNFWLAITLTTFAGLSTGIGSFIAVTTKSTNKKFLCTSLGFSAGVMIYVSMIEIFFKAKTSLTEVLGEKNGYILTVVSFFLGMVFIFLMDKGLCSKNKKYEKQLSSSNDKENLMQMGLFTALAIGIHNFPEGLATFVSTMQDPNVAIPVFFAIAMHNIPEGIAVAVPIYHATGSRLKAFSYSLFSGLAEPIGAIIGWFILMPIMSDAVYGAIFASVAGIMVYISFEELLPTANRYGEHKDVMIGLIFGMVIMAISLLLFV